MTRLVHLTVPALLLLALAAPASAQHTIEVGAGWQNTGATREMTWEPAIHGSRKDVPAFAGWRYTGESRVYYAPFARIRYTNFWSVAGAGNLLGLDLGVGVLGVYLTDALADVPRAERAGRWFVTLEIGLANVRLGVNVTPDAPVSPEVPDPEARRRELRDAIATGQDAPPGTQFYPFGGYSYVALALPVRFDLFHMITSELGVGGFIESSVAALEWPMDRPVSAPAYGYDVVLGLTFRTFGAQ
jgi:hypothetical protein